MLSGHIDHALAIGIPRVSAGVVVPPATRTDGKALVGGLPMGTRLRLDPTLDVAALHLPPVAAMIAVAAQRYGMVVRDTSGSVSFYAEETVGRKSAWPWLLGGLSPSQLLIERVPNGTPELDLSHP